MSPLSSMGLATAGFPFDTGTAGPGPVEHSQPMDLALVPRVTARASTTVVHGTTVVYDELDHNMVVLTARAGSVWARCNGTRPLSDIVANLAAVHGTPLEVVRSDVWSTVCELADEGLLVDARSAVS